MQPHYFIAVPIADETLTQFSSSLELQHYYKTVYEPDDYHLTLRFLGPLTDDQLGEWKQRLQEITGTVPAFLLHLNHLERFGLAERPRVFAVGPERQKSLLRLAQQIDPHPSRPFVPHVTLAKKWNQDVAIPPPEQTPSVHVEAKEIVLYKVCPDKRPRYRAEARFQFTKKQ